jgi:hypothetical protein
MSIPLLWRGGQAQPDGVVLCGTNHPAPTGHLSPEEGNKDLSPLPPTKRRHQKRAKPIHNKNMDSHVRRDDTVTVICL